MKNLETMHPTDAAISARYRVSFLAHLLTDQQELELNERELAGLEQILWDINELLEVAGGDCGCGDFRFLLRLKGIKELIEKGAFTPTGVLEHCRKAIEKIDHFLDSDFKQILALAQAFKNFEEQAKKRIGKEKASAKARGQAEASEADQD